MDQYARRHRASKNTLGNSISGYNKRVCLQHLLPAAFRAPPALPVYASQSPYCPQVEGNTVLHLYFTRVVLSQPTFGQVSVLSPRRNSTRKKKNMRLFSFLLKDVRFAESDQFVSFVFAKNDTN